jgi:glycosyltransferase involved in cell wall biosynthesis
MRILLLTQYYWPENFLINSLVPLLVARGVEVTVLTGKPNYPDGLIFEGYRAGGCHREQHDGTIILRLPIVARGHRSRTRLALNYLSFIFSGILFGRGLVGERGYDLVFVYAPSPLLQALPAIWLARSRQVPLVVWVQDLWPESLSATGSIKNQWLLGAVARVVRLIYRASDRILVQSRAFVAPVAALTDDPTKINYYPNLYKTSSERHASQRATALVKELQAHFSVVFAGNLGTAQALDTIVEAARELLPHPDIRIVLVGSGSLDDWLVHQRDGYGLTNLTLTGRFEASDMSAIFAAAEALLVSLRPDPTFGLTIPSKLQAYLAAGRPVLAALDGEGSRIISEAGAGFCSEAGNAKALAGNVLRLAALSPLERQQMGQSGRRYFDRHFSPDALVDELVEHFKEVVSGREKTT